MKVLITADALAYPTAGVQRYVIELIKALGSLADESDDFEFSVLVGDGVEKLTADSQAIIDYRQMGLGRFHYLLSGIPRLSEKLEAFDIIHCTHPMSPFFRKSKRPKLVMTVHDLIPLIYPQYFTRSNRLGFERIVPLQLRNFDHFIADSDSTKKDVERIWRIDPDRVTRVHLASSMPVDDGSSTCAPPDEPYFLALGTLEPRKNLGSVIEAFIALKQRQPDSLVKLKMVGGQGWKSESVQQLLKEHERDVQWLGRVPDEDIPPLYRNAIALVYPSLYEGFGLPILEAMSLGCPAITSHISSLPEVGGDAAIYVNPKDVSSIADAMGSLLNAWPNMDAIAAASREQAAKFSWQRCARETLDVYRELLG